MLPGHIITVTIITNIKSYIFLNHYRTTVITINATKPNIFIADKIDNIIPFDNTKQRM